MLSWTDCPARTPEQQIIFAQLEILRRLNPTRTVVALGLGAENSRIWSGCE
jgi:hypothetical protein